MVRVIWTIAGSERVCVLTKAGLSNAITTCTRWAKGSVVLQAEGELRFTQHGRTYTSIRVIETW